MTSLKASKKYFGKAGTKAAKLARLDLKTASKDLRNTYKELLKQSALDRRDFNKKLSILKKHGLAYRHVDLRSLEPTKYAQGLVRRIEKTGLFEGKARTQKVSKQEARILKEAGREVRQGRVILGASEESNERLVKKKGEKRRYIQKYEEGELREIPLLHASDWPQYLDELREKWQDFEANGYSLAFRFYGNLSRTTFDDIDSLIDHLSSSMSGTELAQTHFNEAIAKDWSEVAVNLEIYKTHYPVWKREDEARKKRQETRKAKKRTYKGTINKIFNTKGEKAVYQFRASEAAKRKTRRSRKNK